MYNLLLFQIRILSIVPPIVAFLAKSPKTAEYDLSSLRFVMNGAAPAGNDICEELRKRHPYIQYIVQGDFNKHNLEINIVYHT